MKRELRAGVAAYIGLVPKHTELREALADDGQELAPKSTYEGWLASRRLDRTADRLLQIANYYDGKPDADGNTIDGKAMYIFLLSYFGHKIPGSDDTEAGRPDLGLPMGTHPTVQTQQDGTQLDPITTSQQVDG